MTRRRNTTRNDHPSAIPPRDLLAIESSWLDIAKRPIKVRKDGREQEISIGEAVVQKQAENALKGSTHAQGQFLRAIHKAERIARKKAEAEVEQGLEFQGKIKARFNAWVSAGNNPDLCTPHPDDFSVEEGVGWSINGPVDQPDIQAVLKQCDEHDLFFGQAKLEERLAYKPVNDQKAQNPANQPGTVALVMFNLIDCTLPDRFKARFIDLLALDAKFTRMSKRELLKHMHEGWRSLGHRVPRGKQLPGFDEFSSKVQQLRLTVSSPDSRIQCA